MYVFYIYNLNMLSLEFHEMSATLQLELYIIAHIHPHRDWHFPRVFITIVIAPKDL